MCVGVDAKSVGPQKCKDHKACLYRKTWKLICDQPQIINWLNDYVTGISFYTAVQNPITICNSWVSSQTIAIL